MSIFHALHEIARANAQPVVAILVGVAVSLLFADICIRIRDLSRGKP